MCRRGSVSTGPLCAACRSVRLLKSEPFGVGATLLWSGAVAAECRLPGRASPAVSSAEQPATRRQAAVGRPGRSQWTTSRVCLRPYLQRQVRPGPDTHCAVAGLLSLLSGAGRPLPGGRASAPPAGAINSADHSQPPPDDLCGCDGIVRPRRGRRPSGAADVRPRPRPRP